MTTTKIIYLAAAILPFGFIVLAACLFAGRLLARRHLHSRSLSPYPPNKPARLRHNNFNTQQASRNRMALMSNKRT